MLCVGTSDLLDAGGVANHAVEVPQGFTTDFASIPPIFFGLLRPDGLYAVAAVVHDYLYWDQRVDRLTCDQTS